jgi:hypothetical protein
MALTSAARSAARDFPTLANGVFSVVDPFAHVACAPPCIRQGHIRKSAQPHVAPLAGYRAAQYPTPCASHLDEQRQARDLADEVHARRSESLHLDWR